MKNQHDKSVIEHWLRLYNRLTYASYRVETWPDDDSSKKNIDAMCRDGGRTLGIEHTLIEPFGGEKGDAARFLKTLATLENHPSLVEPGYMYIATLAVGSIRSGHNFADVPKELLQELPSKLSSLPTGNVEVVVRAEKWELRLCVQKIRLKPSDPGMFLTGRNWPGDPGPELIIRALGKKIPKLSESSAEKKILLLEKDAVAGTIESQFEQIPADHEVRNLMCGIDEIWSANTSGLEREGVIFTNILWPRLDRATICSLNSRTGRFWRLEAEFV